MPRQRAFLISVYKYSGSYGAAIHHAHIFLPNFLHGLKNPVVDKGLRNSMHALTIVLMETELPDQLIAHAAKHLELGKRGEALAAAYLIKQGYHIVAANFSVPVGRNRIGALINVEIDLIAYEGETLCFIEVKTRASDWFAPPQANVDRRKQRQIARAARAYRRIFDLAGVKYRYDVVTVVLAGEDAGAEDWDIKLLRRYWSDEQLRKRAWSETHYYD